MPAFADGTLAMLNFSREESVSTAQTRAVGAERPPPPGTNLHMSNTR